MPNTINKTIIKERIMAKRIVVYTTITYSTDFDLEELKKEGIRTKKQLLEYAKQNYNEDNIVDFNAEIVDKYEDKPNIVRKGRGSY
jgi:methyl coenzyme M reductase subunit C